MTAAAKISAEHNSASALVNHDSASALIKANSLRLGACGLLLLGASGAGKSALTLALLERAALFGRGGALISDDYSFVRRRGGALYAECPPQLAGAIEIRGAGIFPMPHEPRAELHLAVELAGAGERYPQGHIWHWRAAGATGAGEKSEAGDKAGENGERAAQLPLLKLPQADKADLSALCRAAEAFLFKKPLRKP